MTLPNFVVVGVAKAGTSSLHGYLRQHPDVFMPQMKDPGFFAFNNQADPWRYKVTSREAYEALFADVRGERAIGEVSDTYFDSKVAPANIKAAIPDARLIVSLREPASRAFSLYHMMLRNRGMNEGLSFLEALERGEGLRLGYHDSLKAYFDHFDRSRIRVVLFDDLTRNTLATVQSLFGFLGIDSGFAPELKVFNPGGVPKSKWAAQAYVEPPAARLGPRHPAEIMGPCRQGPAQPQPRQAQDADDRGGARGRPTAFFRDAQPRDPGPHRHGLSRWLRPGGRQGRLSRLRRTAVQVGRRAAAAGRTTVPAGCCPSHAGASILQAANVTLRRMPSSLEVPRGQDPAVDDIVAAVAAHLSPPVRDPLEPGRGRPGERQAEERSHQGEEGAAAGHDGTACGF